MPIITAALKAGRKPAKDDGMGWHRGGRIFVGYVMWEEQQEKKTDGNLTQMKSGKDILCVFFGTYIVI